MVAQSNSLVSDPTARRRRAGVAVKFVFSHSHEKDMDSSLAAKLFMWVLISSSGHFWISFLWFSTLRHKPNHSTRRWVLEDSSQIKPLLYTHKLWTRRTYNIWQPCCQHRGEYNACNACAEIKYSPFALRCGHRNKTTPGKRPCRLQNAFICNWLACSD